MYWYVPFYINSELELKKNMLGFPQWLHYLLRKLLHSKGLKSPAAPRKPKGSEAPVPLANEVAFSEKDCFDCLVDIENWLGKAIIEFVPGGKPMLKGKGRRKTQAPIRAPGPATATLSGPARAGEVVAYGVKKGWIQPSALY
jgi:serine/threonine-protein kinase haspin